MLLFIICFLVWVVIGYASFIFWRTKDYDLTFDDIPTMLLVGIFCGAFAFVIGWFVHGNCFNQKVNKVILKKRKG